MSYFHLCFLSCCISAFHLCCSTPAYAEDQLERGFYPRDSVGNQYNSDLKRDERFRLDPFIENKFASGEGDAAYFPIMDERGLENSLEDNLSNHFCLDCQYDLWDLWTYPGYFYLSNTIGRGLGYRQGYATIGAFLMSPS